MKSDASETAQPQGARTGLIAVGLSIGFVIVSAACRMLFWGSVSFLDEESVLRNTVAGALTLLAIIALTVLTHRRLPTLEHPGSEVGTERRPQGA